MPVIALGAAWPAREALLRLLDALPASAPAVCIMFDTFDGMPADSAEAAAPLTLDWLGRRGAVWAEHGMRLRPGMLLMAPPGAGIAIVEDRLAVTPGPSAHALDAFLLSLARSAHPGMLVMLAGPRFSGAMGAAALRARGGLALAAVDAGTGMSPGLMRWPANDERALRSILASIEAHLLGGRPQHGSLPPGTAKFFDAAGELESLRHHVFPGLIRSKRDGAGLRVWVPGCGTGEAAYSLAIALQEVWAQESGGWGVIPLQIFATDVDGQSLAAARAGCFDEAIAGQVSPERLERWFVRKRTTYTVKPELRELCIFSSHNVLQDPPFSRIDVIWSGGLLGQLGAPLHDHLLRTLHFALNPHGALRLQWSEDAPGANAWFEPLGRTPHLFRRCAKPERVPSWTAKRESGPTLTRWREAASAGMIAEAERLAARHSPPFVVVDAALDVLHFSARMGRYLAPAPVAATLNLLRMVRAEFRPSLADLVRRVTLSGEPAQSSPLLFTDDDSTFAVTLLATPMMGNASERRHTLVMFQDGSAGLAWPSERDSRPALELTRGELQTSREEFRSLQEEFQGVNIELAARISDLARVNSDMRNVLESTRIAIIFLDNQLLLQSFTPAATELAAVTDSDIGEPLGRLALRVDYAGLVADARYVLRTLATLEREVGTADGKRRYLVRLLPYRRIDNFIAGVVVTFVDISATHAAECATRDSEERFRMMAEVVPAFLFIADPQGLWQYVNPPFYASTGLSAQRALGDGWWQVVHAEDLAGTREAWRTALQTLAPLEVECRLRRRDGCDCWFLLRAVPKLDGEGRAVAWFGSCTDIDARQQAAGRQRDLLAELQCRVKNILAVVRSVMLRTVESSTSVDSLSAHLSGRVNAIARVQSVVARNAADAVMLSELVDEELAAHGGHIESQTDIDGPAVLLPGKIAESFGLALHELTTNAIKFGALAVPSGRLRIRWQLYPLGLADQLQQRLVFDWQESGVPVTDLQPDRYGFGRELLEVGLPNELGASTALEFRPGGIQWVIQLDIVTPSVSRLAPAMPR